MTILQSSGLLVAGILGVWVAFSCATDSGIKATPNKLSSDKGGKATEQVPEAKYFASPEEAVPVIADLLRKKEFETLASYYDLSNSDIKRSMLESGDFFIRKKRPEISHPGGFWRYKHPFAPSYKYRSSHQSSRKGVYVIEVVVSIDQGTDSPIQEGRSFFYMRASTKGWQVLPEEVDETPEMPIPNVHSD